MINFFTQPKKGSDFQGEVIDRLDVLEHNSARLRQDIRAIVREEIVSAMKEHSRRGWNQIS